VLKRFPDGWRITQLLGMGPGANIACTSVSPLGHAGLEAFAEFGASSRLRPMNTRRGNSGLAPDFQGPLESRPPGSCARRLEHQAAVLRPATSRMPLARQDYRVPLGLQDLVQARP